MRKGAVVVLGTLCAVGLVGTMLHPSAVRAGQDTGSYKQVDNWAQLPEGKQWGVMSAVGLDAKGNVYAFERAEPSTILVFDDHGKYVRTFGDASMTYAHGLKVSRDGSIWATDRKVQQAFKYSPDGKLLMTLGQKDVAGDMTSTDAFNGVSDIAVAKNGDIFASDGEGANTRVVKFSKDGKFIKTWGTKGAEAGQMSTPHAIAIDSRDHVFVADRGNKRVQEFDADGKFLSQTTAFGTPAALAFDKNDVLYVADGAPENQVVIGTADGKIIETIHGLNGPHGIVVSPSGDTIYVSETGGKTVRKYVKK